MRLIDADKIRVELWMAGVNEEVDGERGVWVRYKKIEQIFDNAPTVDPIRHGEWIGTELDGYFVSRVLKCSVCGCLVEDDEPTWNYCPNCGAKMDGERKEE